MTRSKLRMSCSPPPAKSTGLTSVAVFGERGRELGARGLGELWKLQAFRDHQVGRDDGVAAAVRRERDPAPLRPPVREEAHGDVDDLLRRGDELDPGTQAGRPDRGEVAGERARVGAGGAWRSPRWRRRRAGRPASPRRRPPSPRGRTRARPGSPPGRRRSASCRSCSASDSTSSAAWTSAWFPERDEAREAEPELGADHADLEREVAALRDEARSSPARAPPSRARAARRSRGHRGSSARRGRRPQPVPARRSRARGPRPPRPSRRARR